MESPSLSPSVTVPSEQPVVPPPWQHAFDAFVEFQRTHRGVSSTTTAGDPMRGLHPFAAPGSSSKQAVSPRVARGCPEIM
ncbi:MAG TPA: hypothetical protein VFS43_15990, partial [Polyangiaceae bacterium]|nr:hypothetical protein [Polyangiaceae bacterium]